MADKRELILARLFGILQAIPNVVHCFRNRAELPDEKRPAITLLDGDETTFNVVDRQPSIASAPVFCKLDPEIYVSLKGAKPDNLEVGENLNVWRAKIIKAILTDADLIALLGSNGQVHYNGCVTDLKKGHGMNGELGLDFSLSYNFKPADL